MIMLILRRLSVCASTRAKHLSTKKNNKNKNETEQNNNKTKIRGRVSLRMAIADQLKLQRTQEWNTLIEFYCLVVWSHKKLLTDIQQEKLKSNPNLISAQVVLNVNH